MKCCICGCNIEGYGNNPYPLCAEDDVESRCCDVCNNYVIRARLISAKGERRKIKQDDMVVIFYSSMSDSPTKSINDNGKFLAGKATDNEALPEGQWEGGWGNFIVDEKKDSYVIVDF